MDDPEATRRRVAEALQTAAGVSVTLADPVPEEEEPRCCLFVRDLPVRLFLESACLALDAEYRITDEGVVLGPPGKHFAAAEERRYDVAPLLQMLTDEDGTDATDLV